jgi:hypothetical protein
MKSISLDQPVVEHSGTSISKTTIPIYLYATVLSSLSIIIGLVWDISWHMSIGRDGLFSPPHLAIYLGGVTAGLFSGYRVLKLTFAGTPYERAKSVHFWGFFYGSLGNLFCIWGAITMLTSAPFDDWWHNTYGLDVTILSPPHVVLLLGMITIQFGAIISVLAYQNLNAEHVHHDNISQKGFNVLFALCGGFVLCMIFIVGSEYLSRHDMKGVLFYQVASLLFPILFVSFSVSSKTRWGATYAALVYSLFLMIANWVLPLFPATPKLGPVLNPVTSFQPFEFPLLLILPALAIDYLTSRYSSANGWLRAAIYGAAFLFVLFPFQYFFGDVLMASKGHWFFGTSKWYFSIDPNWVNRYSYSESMYASATQLLIGLPIALVIAVLSSRVGIAWGNWMKKIVR